MVLMLDISIALKGSCCVRHYKGVCRYVNDQEGVLYCRKVEAKYHDLKYERRHCSSVVFGNQSEIITVQSVSIQATESQRDPEVDIGWKCSLTPLFF
jgi:hypothetical protein